MREWCLLTSLLEMPPPWTAWQRRLIWITFLVVVATRIFALASSLWDWDEAQFASGVREFNVGAKHHPHPPGFPLFMLAAKIVRPFATSDFRATQTIVFLAACALFPLALFLARELRFSFTTAYLGALLFVFFPNVWFYGGTAFSDIPGVATVLAAVWLLFRGCRDPRSYLLGAVVLGVAAGIRSQALLFGLVPLAVASWWQWRSSRRRVVAAALILATIIGASYIGAALSSDSIRAYRGGVEGLQSWVRDVDSFRNPRRLPLLTIAPDYLLRPMAGGRLPVVVCVLALIGLLAAMIRPRLGVWLAVATFLPFSLVAWFGLDLNSIHRYSTSYVFLWALLAAHGAAVLAIPLRRWASCAQVALLLFVTARSAFWTIPALQEVRRTESPTHAAMQWLRARVPARHAVWVHGSLAPFAEYYLADRDVRFVNDRQTLPRVSLSPNDFFVTEGLESEAAVTFRRERKRLMEIARPRYFETSIVRLASIWTFDEGWYGQESDGSAVWYWMGRRGKVLLPAGHGRMLLRMTLDTANGEPSDVEVRLNNEIVARVHCGDQPLRGEWVVPSRTDAPNELVILSSNVVNLKARGMADDPRDLGIRLSSYSWSPAP